ncbi:hypothetical protein LZF96_20465 [Streptomyces sp. ST2-7A]|nr:hypothetical protein [Streptomyces sp. ST2-7A]
MTAGNGLIPSSILRRTPSTGRAVAKRDDTSPHSGGANTGRIRPTSGAAHVTPSGERSPFPLAARTSDPVGR